MSVLVPAILIGEFFNLDTLDRVQAIRTEVMPRWTMLKRIEEEVVLPRMDHINFVTGQANLPYYFVWALLHATEGRR